MNVALNRQEAAAAQERLLSTPELVTLGTHQVCNARCIFCPEGAAGNIEALLSIGKYPYKISVEEVGGEWAQLFLAMNPPEEGDDDEETDGSAASPAPGGGSPS